MPAASTREELAAGVARRYRRYKSEANVPAVRSLAENKWPRLVLYDAALFIDDWSSFENSAFCDRCCEVSCYMDQGSPWGLGGFW